MSKTLGSAKGKVSIASAQAIHMTRLLYLFRTNYICACSKKHTIKNPIKTFPNQRSFFLRQGYPSRHAVTIIIDKTALKQKKNKVLCEEVNPYNMLNMLEITA